MPDFGAVKPGDRSVRGAELREREPDVASGFAKQVRGAGEETRKLIDASKRLDNIDSALVTMQAMNGYKKQSRELQAQAMNTSGLDAEAFIEQNETLYKKTISDIESLKLGDEANLSAMSTLSNAFNQSADRITSHAYNQKKVGHSDELAIAEDMAAEDISQTIREKPIREVDAKFIAKELGKLTEGFGYEAYSQSWGEQDGQARKELGQFAIVSSAVERMITADPVQAFELLDNGSFDEFFTTDQTKKLKSLAQKQAKSNKTALDGAVKENHQTADREMAGMIVEGTLTPLIAMRMALDAGMTGDQIVKWVNRADKMQDEKFLKSEPMVYADMLNKITRDPESVSHDDIYNRIGKDLSTKDAVNLDGMRTEPILAQDKDVMALFKTANENGVFGVDQAGNIEYARQLRDFRKWRQDNKEAQASDYYKEIMRPFESDFWNKITFRSIGDIKGRKLRRLDTAAKRKGIITFDTFLGRARDIKGNDKFSDEEIMEQYETLLVTKDVNIGR